MKKINRQRIKESITSVSPWDLSGSPEDICKELRTTQDAYLKDRNDVIESYWSWDSGIYDSDTGAFELVITRLENDKEYNDRVKENAKSEQKKQFATKLKEYLKLKNKFDKE